MCLEKIKKKFKDEPGGMLLYTVGFVLAMYATIIKGATWVNDADFVFMFGTFLVVLTLPVLMSKEK